MLADPMSAMDVACGENGAASGMAPGKGYVDVSTVDDTTSKLISARIKDTGALFLEAPVSGSKKPAEDGQLIFLTAGDKSLYETVAPFLDIMGKHDGSFFQRTASQRKSRTRPKRPRGVSFPGCHECTIVLNQGTINDQNPLYPTAFPLKHQQKDLRLAHGLAESVSQPTPIAAAANELYKIAKSHGLSAQDFSAVIEALKSKLLH